MSTEGSKADKATLYDLQQPQRLETALARDKVNDCLSCRLMGAGAFGGLGVYSYVSGQRQLQLQRQKILLSGSRFGMRSRKLGITMISATLVGMGFWRLVN